MTNITLSMLPALLPMFYGPPLVLILHMCGDDMIDPCCFDMWDIITLEDSMVTSPPLFINKLSKSENVMPSIRDHQ